MKVWIDQDECTGSGICEVIEPSVFVLGDEGLALVRAGDVVLPAGPAGTVTVAPENEREVQEASLACPGRCIRIEAE
jgi:ferredoxin